MLVVPRLKQAARRSKQSDTTPTLMSCDAHQNVVQLAYCNTMKRFSCIYLYELLNMQWAQPFVSSWRVHHKIPCIASRMRWPIAGPWRRLYRTGCGIRFFSLWPRVGCFLRRGVAGYIARWTTKTPCRSWEDATLPAGGTLTAVTGRCTRCF